MLGPEPIGAEAFRGNHDVVAFCLNCAPDDLFGLATHIDVGSVDEVAARVDEGVDDRRLSVSSVGALFARPNIMAPRHAVRDLEAGVTEILVLHSQLLPIESDNILPLLVLVLFRAGSNRGHKRGASTGSHECRWR